MGGVRSLAALNTKCNTEKSETTRTTATKTSMLVIGTVHDSKWTVVCNTAMRVQLKNSFVGVAKRLPCKTFLAKRQQKGQAQRIGAWQCLL